ncbi:MAG: ABC transporter substrate-binding protein [Steroidobacteraceae bacterium]
MSPRCITRRAALAQSLGLTVAAGLGTLPQAIAAVPRRGGKVRVASLSSSTADTLDPARGALSTDYARLYTIYSGLLEYDTKLAPRPALAEEILDEERTLWTFKLRRGVEFHDGKPLTAADVVYSLLRHKDPATASKMKVVAEQFAEVRASGPLEVQIRLTGPNADLPTMLCDSHFLIIADGTTDFRTANGTGPFRIKEFTPGVRTVATRNERYWKSGRPYLDEVEIIGIPDESARVNALLSGDVHIVNAVNPRSTRRIRDSGSHAILPTPSGLYTDLVMRQDAVPTNNPAFVRAMQLLFDRELIRKALFRGFGTIANDHPIPPWHPYFNPELPQRGHDPDRARWLLERAGLLGVRLPVYASPAAEGSVDMASVLQDAAGRIGLRLAVNRVPADGYWSRHWMKHPMSFGNTNPRPTADMLFTQLFRSDAEWNESGWRNRRFDELLLLARSATDEGRRKMLYGEMQQLVHEHCGLAIPLFINLIDAYDVRVQGFGSIATGGLMGYQFADHVWLAR